LNYLLFINIVIILSLAGIMTGRLYSFVSAYGAKMKYIYPEPNFSPSTITGNAYATYYILFNSLIPLAMVVCIEIAKMAYSKMMEDDVEMMNITDPKA
jgi:magnesium-transporting ATPase (P-type)